MDWENIEQVLMKPAKNPFVRHLLSLVRLANLQDSGVHAIASSAGLPCSHWRTSLNSTSYSLIVLVTAGLTIKSTTTKLIFSFCSYHRGYLHLKWTKKMKKTLKYIWTIISICSLYILPLIIISLLQTFKL